MPNLKKPKSKLSYIRKERNITQKQLARAWGVSEVTIQSWEKHQAKAYKLQLYASLCHLLLCDPIDLIYPDTISSLDEDFPSPTLEQIQYELFENKSFTNPPTKIAELRKSKGFTQEQVAEVLDVSVNTVGNWERNSSSKFIKYAALCRILECKPSDLVDSISDETLSKISDLHQKLEIVITEKPKIYEIRNDIEKSIKGEIASDLNIF